MPKTALVEHKTLRCAIQDLSKAEEDSHPSIFLSHLTPKQQAKIVNLVGQRCTVNCQLNGKAAKSSMGHWGPSVHGLERFLTRNISRWTSEGHQ